MESDVGTIAMVWHFVATKGQRECDFLGRDCLAGAMRTTGDGDMDADVHSNAAYYRNRADVERALAEKAPNDDIGKIHLQLAERYSDLAEEFESQTQFR
ncbi:MAG TPA: hypothetical protein VM531_03780 [Sphingomicrobium sp.]|nr:hypothetical protein [Sphingomicrobium sp.]